MSEYGMTGEDGKYENCSCESTAMCESLHRHVTVDILDTKGRESDFLINFYDEGEEESLAPTKSEKIMLTIVRRLMHYQARPRHEDRPVETAEYGVMMNRYAHLLDYAKMMLYVEEVGEKGDFEWVYNATEDIIREDIDDEISDVDEDGNEWDETSPLYMERLEELVEIRLVQVMRNFGGDTVAEPVFDLVHAELEKLGITEATQDVIKPAKRKREEDEKKGESHSPEKRAKLSKGKDS